MAAAEVAGREGAAHGLARGRDAGAAAAEGAGAWRGRGGGGAVRE
jgi:hypothetical protein